MAQILSENPNFQGKDDRSDAWTLTCDLWVARKEPPIVLPINPDSLELKLPIVGTEVTAYGGKIVSTRRNPRTGSVLDFPVISVKINSGNIIPAWSQDAINAQHRNNAAAGMETAGSAGLELDKEIIPPVRHTENLYGRYGETNVAVNSKRANQRVGFYAGNPEIPVGVQNLYALLALVNEPWIISNSERSASGQKRYSVLNRVQLVTSSLAFPSLTFFGYIPEDGIQWSETADSYNNFDTTFSIVVTSTKPKLHRIQIAEMLSTYKRIFAYAKTTEYDPRIQWSGGTCPDESGISGTCPDPTNKEEPTMLDRINGVTASVTSFSDRWLGDPSVLGQTPEAQAARAGMLRNSLSVGIGATADALNNYAMQALRRIDPIYADTVAKRKQYAERTQSELPITDSRLDYRMPSDRGVA